MTIAAGTRLGRYEIRSQIGAGGMGEVYRARDPNIDRDVAIKVLPSEFSTDTGRLQRFAQEARAAGKLNHPNILAIHDVDAHNGTPFVVYELLEGATLRERLLGGPLSGRKSLDYALQIARGLAAAHGKGIVHRDLKPENVFITHDERLKILDFGLAKLFETVDQSQPQTEVATRQLNTNPGAVVGTVGYMAPEQVRGDRADHRTDIFALGVILYEMLSGERAFRGDSAVETLNAILKDDPPELNTTARNVSPPVERIMRRCLEKKPDERFQSARDFAFALEAISEPTRSSPTLVESPKAGRRIGREHIAWLIAGLLLLTTATLLFLYLGRTPAEGYGSRFLIYPPEKSDLMASDLYSPVALSPNGRQLALTMSTAGRTNIWLRPLDSLSAALMDNTEGARNPFWSPDGRFIGFFADGKLKKIAASGGIPAVVCEAAPNTNFGTWNKDDTILFTVGQLERGILRVSAAGGEVTEVSRPDPSRGERYHFWPQFLPDGRHYLFLAGQMRRDQSAVYVGSLDSGQTKRLLQASSRVIYTPPGYLLYVREGSLLAHPFDAASNSLTGDQMTIAQHVGNFSATGNAYFSVSANGDVLAYMAAGIISRLVWLNRSGAEEGSVGAPGEYIWSRLSPDGQRLAVNIIDSRDATNDIWINDLARATFRRFTFTPGLENGPVWSPDGRRVIYAHDKDGPPHLFLKALGDPGEGEMLLPPIEAPQHPLDWSPDGQFLIYRAYYSASGNDLMILPMSGERKPIPFVNTSFSESEARFSPDGKWIAFVTEESGRREVYVQRFQGGGERYQISNAAGRSPRWRRDGRELFYLAPDQKVMAVPVKAGDGFEAGTPVALFSVEARNAEFDITPDGQRFLVNTITGTPARPLTVATDWMRNLKR